MRRFGTLGAILAIVAAACTSSGADEPVTTSPPATAAPSTTTTAAPTTTTTEPEADGGLVVLADSSLGSVLVDGDGNVLYLFTPDEQGESVCYDECAGFWPPLVGEFDAGDGVDAALMGSVARTDGSEQVTYNGWPLYYFANDAAPGDTNGQGVNEVWYVLDAAGDGIGLDIAAAGLVALADSSLGSILVDGDGNVLYLFTPDEQGESVCYDECAGFWPPLVGEFDAGDGVDAALMGSVARTDGSEQVTYNGWPLYYFANDAAPGDTNGQGVNEVWYVLDAAGDGIGLDIAAAGLVALADSSLGSILVDGDGNVLYLFTPDEQGESVCYDECAGFWPPLVGEFDAGDGVDAALMGSVARTDGSEQVTYNGWPLYYFANDAAPGDTNGQGVNEVWYVLDAAGDGIGLGG